jgi:hypothetical protein
MNTMPSSYFAQNPGAIIENIDKTRWKERTKREPRKEREREKIVSGRRDKYGNESTREK